MSLILHKTDVSPSSRTVMMVLEILGLKVEYKEVSLPSRDHYKPEYLKQNPMHTVPLLEDGNLILADSHAIITYLVSKYGKEEHENLYPKELVKRAIIDQKLYFDASFLFPRLRNVIYRISNSKNDMVMDIKHAYEVMEKYLENDKFLAGDNITLADISCVATLSSLDCMVPVEPQYVKLLAWWNRLKEMDWYQNKNVPGLNVFNVFSRGFIG